MAFKRLSMRKVHLALRLHFAAELGIRAVARSINASPSTVREYIRRAEAAGLSWPLPEGMDERVLEARLFPPSPRARGGRPLPEWAKVHRELRRKGVTLALLWQEYKAAHPDGLQYSRFCDRYRAWAERLDVVMRQTHRAGEKLFVDYAGHTVPVVDPRTGQRRQAQIFVAVLGASSYTYAEASWTQSLADWCASHVRALAFLGGAPELLVPDNLRSGVSTPHRYDPEINPTYQELAEHYAMAVVPARVRRPRDKAKVEAGVLLVERWVLAALRNRTFFSLAELNAAIARELERLNARAFRKLPGSRRELFEQLERPALQPLPSTPWVFAQWKKARVSLDYHLELERHHYSVPWTLARKELMVRYTAATVECFYRGERVASHPRAFAPGGHTTVAEHMPEKHRRYAQCSPEHLVRQAERVGPATTKLISNVLAAPRHPEQRHRTGLGILRLGKAYGDTRLEAACRRALLIGARSVRSLESILRHRLDERPLEHDPDTTLPPEHENLRGPGYFH